MGKRYFCDYCDRYFVDDLDARKKHLSGMLHMRVMNEYYAPFKDAKTLYTEEIAKIPCKRFMRYKECSFGSNCKFSHYSREQLEYLKYQAQEEDYRPIHKREDSLKSHSNAVDSWSQKVLQEKAVQELNSERPAFTFQFPPSFRERRGLPTSLQPIKLDAFTFSDFEAW